LIAAGAGFLKFTQSGIPIMKNCMAFALRAHLFVITLLLAPTALQAQSWSGATSGDWLTGTNWSGGTAAGSTSSTDTDIAVFGVNANNTIGINMTTASGVYYLGAIDNTNSAGRTITNTTGTSGTLTLNGATVNGVANTIIRNSVNGSLDIRNDTTSGTLGLDLAGSSNVIQNTNSGAISIRSSISGSGGITRQGSGTGILQLYGNNSYAGVTATNGIITIFHSNALGATGSGNNTTIAATGSNTGGVLQLSGGITTAENITITGTTEAGSFFGAIRSINGSNTVSGDITLASPTGSIRLEANAGNLTFSGSITQTGTSRTLVLEAESGRTLTVNNAIANNGGDLSTDVGGTVILNGVSGSGIGNTTMFGGTLKLGVTNALNTTRPLELFTNSGTRTFDLAGFGQAINALIGSGTSAASTDRIVTNSAAGSGTSILTVGNGGGSGTFNGQINNGATASIQLIKTGAGTQTLSGSNSFTGGTRIDAGTLQIGNGGTTGSLSASSSITNNGTLAFNRSNAITQGTDFASVIAGIGAVTKLGSGTLTLNGNNSYTGVTAINGGAVAISSNNALGATGSGSHTTIAASGDTTSGGVLQLSNNINSPESFTITGTTEQNSFAAAIQSASGNNTLSGNITLAGSGAIRLNTTGAGTLTFAGNITQSTTSHPLAISANSGTTINVDNALAINGGVLRVFSPGKVVLKGASGSGIGGTVISQGGTVELGITDALNTTASLSIGASSATDTGNFSLVGFDQTVNALVSGGSAATRVVRNNHASTSSTLTVGNGGGSGTFLGTIVNGSTGTLALVKTGLGNQTLSGTNTFTGGTRIDSGILTLDHATDTLANTGAVNVNGGTLALGGNSDTVGAVTLTSGSITSSTGVLTGASYAVHSGSVSAILGGSGVALTKTTGGTVTLTGANTYGGDTIITAGTLKLGSGGSFANSPRIIVGDAAGSAASIFDVTEKTSFTIGATQTLMGKGQVLLGQSTTLTIDGVFSPGNSPGLFTYDGGGTATLAGTTLMEIQGTVRGSGYDAVDVLNGTTLNLGGVLQLDFNQAFPDDTVLNLFTPSSGSSLAGTFSTISMVGSAYGDLAFTQAGTSGIWNTNVGAANQSMTFTSSSGTLSILAVPEPGTLTLAALGLAAGLGWHLRRRA
jgi:autotransporter-associated beta strand protein